MCAAIVSVSSLFVIGFFARVRPKLMGVVSMVSAPDLDGRRSSFGIKLLTN